MALHEEGDDALELVQIRRVDEWRIEWGFAPYERAAQAFRQNYQAKRSQFPVKDVASVYKTMAAMSKENR